MRITSYSARSDDQVAYVSGYGTVEVAFDLNGPAEATVELPRDSAHLAAGQLMPGGIGVFYRIADPDRGAPQWLGRVVSPQASLGSPNATLRLTGPSLWLDRMTVLTPRVRGSAAEAVRRVLTNYPLQHRIRFGTMESGVGYTWEPAGDTIWGLMTSMADSLYEQFYLVSNDDCLDYYIDWYVRGYRRDRSGEITLVEGKNCEWEIAYNLAPNLDDLIAVGESTLFGDGVHSAVANYAENASIIGMNMALKADIASFGSAGSSGATNTSAHSADGAVKGPTRPDLDDESLLIATLVTEMRRRLTPKLTATVTVTDENLWGIEPGDLVATRWPSEITGLYANSIAFVRTASYRLAPDRALSLSVDLWEGSF